MQNITRRNFIQNSAIGSFGLMLTPTLVSAVSGFSTFAGEGSNAAMMGLTPIAVIDNACMLAFCSGKLSHAGQQSVTTDIRLRNTPGNKGRLAVVAPPLSSKLIDLIRIVKSDKETKYAHEKRVIAFGWAAVNSVQRNINPALTGKSYDEIALVRMTQDALVIRGFSSPEYDVSKALAKDMEDLLNSLQIRTLTRVHTLKPDPEDGIGWVNRMADWRRENTRRMQEFAKIIVSPDNQMAGSSFYSTSDNIVKASNQLQKAKYVKADEIMSYLKQGASSIYGKALAEATENIFAIDSYLEGRSSENELVAKLKL
jgi:hypothetical protein